MSTLSLIVRIAGFLPLALCLLSPGQQAASSPLMPAIAIGSMVLGLIAGAILSSIDDARTYASVRYINTNRL